MTISVQVRNVVRVHQRRSVGSYLAEAAVLGAQIARNRVLLQDRCDGSSQRVSGEVLDGAVGLAQRGQSLLLSLAVAHEVEGDERAVEHVPKRVGSCDKQGVAVVNNRFVWIVRFFQPPVVRDGAGAVIVVWGRQLC